MEKQKKTVLMIAYYFPPIGEAGVPRTVKFVKYLHRLGWDVNVLTSFPVNALPIDKSLEDDILGAANILRIRSHCFNSLASNLSATPFRKLAFFLNLFAIPDDCVLWLGPAFSAAKGFIEEKRIRVLYTTSSPFTSHLIGFLLKKGCGDKLRWIADFRDPWSQNKLRNKSIGNMHKVVDFFLEQKVLNTADYAIHTTETNAINTTEIFNISHYKVKTIYNGYDEEDFKTPFNIPSIKKDCFNVVYTGNFYSDYNPLSFLKSIQGLLERNEDSNIRITFVGSGSIWLRDYLDNEESDLKRIAPHLELKDFVDHSKLLELYEQADLLLLVLPKYMDYCVPGKLFEYLRVEKPIMAIIPPQGEAAKIISRTQSGYVVDPDDHEKISSKFQMIYSKWKNSTLTHNPNRIEIKKYERSALTKQLESLFTA